MDALKQLDSMPALMKYGMCMEVLEPLGVTEDEFRGVLRAGVLRKIQIYPGAKGKYSREELRVKLVEPILRELEISK